MADRKRRHRIVLRNIQSGNAGTSWADVEALLVSLGAERRERSGSAVMFTLHGVVLRVHRVHGRRHCGAKLVGRLRSFLVQAGVL